MSTSITAVNAKLTASASGFILGFEAASKAARVNGTRIDSEMDKLAKNVRKKFTGSSIGKDLLAGLGLGGGAAVAFTAFNAGQDFFEKRAAASKEHTASLERQAELAKEIGRIGLSDEQNIAAAREDAAAAYAKLAEAKTGGTGDEARAKVDQLTEAYHKLNVEVAKLEEAGRGAAAEEHMKRMDRMVAAGLNEMGIPAMKLEEFRVGAGPRASLAELRAQAAEINRLMSAPPDGMEAGSPAFDARQLKLADDLRTKYSAIGDEQERIRQLAGEVGGTIAGSFEEAVFSGQKLSDVLDGLIQDLLRMAFRQTITGPMASGLSSLFSGWFGGGKASGGPVSAGTAYMVGERGPELFLPGASGAIVPNHALGGGGGNVYHIDARGTDEGVVQRLQAALFALAGPGVVERRALAAHAGTLRRGGGAARALGA